MITQKYRLFHVILCDICNLKISMKKKEKSNVLIFISILSCSRYYLQKAHNLKIREISPIPFCRKRGYMIQVRVFYSWLKSHRSIEFSGKRLYAKLFVRSRMERRERHEKLKSETDMRRYFSI